MAISSSKPKVIHEVLKDCNVVALQLPHPMDDERLDLLTAELQQVTADRLGQRWVVDLTSVPYLNSAMLGLMVNLRHRIRSGGGTLVLCGMSPMLQDLFRNSSMERLFTIVKDRVSALK